MSSRPRSSGTVTLESVRIRLARRRVGAECLRVRLDVVGHDEPSRLEERPREGEERLVVVLLGVEEHEVEGVLRRAERFERIALDQVGPLVEAGVRDVRAPGLAFRRVVLERRQPTSQHAGSSGEPDRRVAARGADLQHLDSRLARSDCEEKAAGRRRDLPRPLHGRQPRLTLGRILGFEPREHTENAIVDHGSATSTTTMPSSRTETG